MIYPVCCTSANAVKWLESTATTRCTGGINISLLNQQKATAWFSKPASPLDTVCPSHIAVTSPRTELGGLWHLITVKVLLFSHWVNQHSCDKSTVKPTWSSPLLHFSASISFSFLPSSQVWWLSAIMPVSMSPAAAEQSAGRPVRLPLAPCCEHCSGGGTEWESGELLIPCTIGHLNPRQAPYLHWAKALPEPYDRAGRMITPRLAVRDP